MADLTTKDRALLVRIARENALKTISAAIEGMLSYAELYRQEVEHRLGVPAGDERAAEDEVYGKILQAYVDLGQAKIRLNEIKGESAAAARP